jgi:large subunit ribosomal protein L10
MDRTQKETAVGELKTKLAKVTSLVVADFRGITVQAVTRARDDFRAAGCNYQVIKNTLIELAIKGTSVEPMSKLLKGPTALIWTNEDPAAPAKVAAKWAKESEKFVIKGGFVDGQVLDKAGVMTLASMPGKDELRATLLATFLSAPQHFVQTLMAGPQNFMYLLDAMNKKSSEGQSQAA